MDFTAVGIHDFYTFLLVFCRVTGLIVTAPLWGTKAVPRTVKVGFAFIFSLALVPLVAPQTGPVPNYLLVLVAEMLKNAVFGLALGYLAHILFAAIEMAGFFVDTQMGFGLLNLFSPFSEQPASVLGLFQSQLAMTLYLLANGHLILLGALTESFTALPPSVVSPQGSLGLTMVPILKTMFVLGFRLALPAAGVLVVVDIAFGLVARMVPQVNVFIVGIPAKIILGLATVALLLPVLAIIVGEINAGTMAGFHDLVAQSR